MDYKTQYCNDVGVPQVDHNPIRNPRVFSVFVVWVVWHTDSAKLHGDTKRSAIKPILNENKFRDFHYQI